MNSLAEIVRDEITRLGVMPWARFMDLALYHPQHGYYEIKGRVGRKGDYFTSVSVGSLFGELLAFWISEKLKSIPNEVQVIEAGANEGQMALDILNWLQKNRPNIYRRVKYVILEPSLTRRQWQGEMLDAHGSKVRWMSDWQEIPPASVTGVVLSNELLDAFPVEIWRWDATQHRWHEFGVTYQGGRLVWVSTLSAEPYPKSLELFTSSLGAVLPHGYQRELCPAAVSWWHQASSRLAEGWLLTFDYGGSEEDFWMADRSQGSLRGYRKHQAANVLEADSGEVDLTASVNFTSILSIGEDVGLITEFYDRQQIFLMEIVQRWLEAGFELAANQTRALATLTRPELLGTKFKAILQHQPASNNSAAKL